MLRRLGTCHAVQLVAEPLDVIQAVQDHDCVTVEGMIHLALELPAGDFFGRSICG